MTSRVLSNTTESIIPDITSLDPHFTLFLIQIILILSICEALSLIGMIFHQPRVIFEILGGIILGPSVLGNFPVFEHQLFPSSSLDYITLVAQIGLNFYIFIIGLEVDYSIVVYSFVKTSSIALTSMLVPFALGIAISPLLFEFVQIPDKVNSNLSTTMQFVSFFVFIGTALSITAFPVLARIINETPLKLTNIGGVTLSAAAINDAVAWVLLVIAISLSRSASSLSSLYIILSIFAYTFLLFTVGRYLLGRFVSFVENCDIDKLKRYLYGQVHLLFGGGRRTGNTGPIIRNVLSQENLETSSNTANRINEQNSNGSISERAPRPSFNVDKRLHHLFVVIIILFLASAYFVSLLGIDSIIGSLLFGIIVPRKSKVHHYCLHHLSHYTIYFLLPIYFTSSGLKTNFTKLHFIPDFWLLLLVCAVATVGKISGAGTVAYYFGYSVRESLVIAILMNTRGLIELVVLNVGFDAGILNERIFSMFVIMCLFTTLISYPLVSWIYGDEITDVRLKRRQERIIGGEDGGYNSEGGDEISQHVTEEEKGERIDTNQTISTILPEEGGMEELFSADSDTQAFNNIRKAYIDPQEEWKEVGFEEMTSVRTNTSNDGRDQLFIPHNYHAYFIDEGVKQSANQPMKGEIELDKLSDIAL